MEALSHSELGDLNLEMAKMIPLHFCHSKSKVVPALNATKLKIPKAAINHKSQTFNIFQKDQAEFICNKVNAGQKIAKLFSKK